MIYLTAMLVIWGYIIAFFILTAFAAERAGRPVWLFGAGSHKQALPATLFRISFALAAFVPPLAYWLPPESPIAWVFAGIDPGFGIAAAGSIVMAIGAIFALYSQYYMGASWRIGAAEGRLGSIVDSGPFAYSRNPVFVGQIILFAGMPLLYPGIVQLLATVALVIAVRLQVVVEERVIEQEFGAAYLQYKSRVPRWI